MAVDSDQGSIAARSDSSGAAVIVDLNSSMEYSKRAAILVATLRVPVRVMSVVTLDARHGSQRTYCCGSRWRRGR